ncbi:MAG: ThuA domain-containing protein [Pirellulales bacterium]|nr:ThuA domain-containing protein [Pirellulales bacterium]
MKRREVLAAGGAAWALSWLGAHELLGKSKVRRKLLFFTKSAGFEHPACRREGDALSHIERVITELAAQHGFDVECTKDGRVFDSDLDAYDAYFFYTTGDLTQPGTDRQPPMSARGKERLLAAVAGGKGFLGSHCASDTFHSPGPAREEQSERDPYIAMLGGEFISHGPQQVARQVVASADFPGLRGLGEAFEINDEWYSLKNFPDDLHVILVQDTQGMNGKDYQRPPYPATWARRHEQGRVFYTSMGHREDVWTNPTFQQILLGALAWAFGDVEFDPKPNIKEVTPGAHVMPPA